MRTARSHRRSPGTARIAALAVALSVTLALILAGCSAPDESPSEASAETPAETPADNPDTSTSSPAPPATSPSPRSSDAPSPPPPAPPSRPISVAALAEADLAGSRLRLGAVREQTPAYVSYDVTFRSTTTGRGTRPLTISGVLNVPTGDGPFPAVVLAHGYIEPASYVRGQGMTRERGYLAQRGYVALHVDYRNHAESSVDPRVEMAVRLGYSADVVAAVRALRDSSAVDVDPDRIAYFGRSMGGGVVLKALEAHPELVRAAVAWASVSSLEAQNFRQFIRPDAPREVLRDRTRGRHGLPDDDPEFWRGISSRPEFGRITEPVLLAHGRFDDTCPPAWAEATHSALERAGVDSTLEWYDDGHAFGPAFTAAMDRTIRFLDRRMPGQR